MKDKTKTLLRNLGFLLFFCAFITGLVLIFTRGNGNNKCNQDSDCPENKICKDGKCVKEDNYPSIQNQPNSSIQLANNTSEDFLHIFIQCHSTSKKWNKIGGNGKIYDPVDWDTDNPNGGNYAWNPPGAVILAEVIIPNGEYILLNIGADAGTFIMQPIKMKKPDNSTPLKLGDDVYSIIMKQSSLLYEGAKDAVADISGVNGINFRVVYSLTSDGGNVRTMKIQKNPCLSVANKFKMEVGCWSPVKQICGATPTCDCYPGTQNCAFNSCSTTLFDIPDNLKQYIDKHDGGIPHEVVKPFINQNKNLKKGSDQSNYCDDIQYNSGDFTTYCYDYNDIGSSPYLRYPYKVKIVYYDL